MTRKHAGFTDLRILGGSRQRGGGVDADPRIKLPPDLHVQPATTAHEARRHRSGGPGCSHSDCRSPHSRSHAHSEQRRQPL